MTDLMEFIEARLTEDEQLARAVEGPSPRPWEAIIDADAGPGVRTGTDDEAEWQREINYQVWHCDDEADGCPDAARTWIAEAKHIARHDPARVLREVEAKRRLIADHAIPADRWPDDSYHQQRRDVDQSCAGCGANYREEPMVEDINDCPVLRAVAAVWSDHSNYRTEWAPS